MEDEGIEVFRNYPGQLAVVLVSEPGEGKKTTALKFPRDLMGEVGVRLFAGYVSNEKLLHKLGTMPDKRAVLTIISPELSTLLTKAHYNEGLVNNLTDLFDCEEREYETHSHGNIALKSVCVTLGAASTPESIGRSIPATAQGTGFLSRLIIAYSPKGQHENPLVSLSGPDPLVVARNANLRASLLQRLKQYNGYAGPFQWTRDAAEWYIDWYRRYPVPGLDGHEIPKRPKGAGWPERLPQHLLRVGMSLEVSSSGGCNLSSGSLMLSEQILREHCTDRMRYSLAYIGRHAEADGQDRILSLFREKQSLNTADIYMNCRRFFRDANALRAALFTLRVSQVISLSGTDLWTLIRDPDDHEQDH